MTHTHACKQYVAIGWSGFFFLHTGQSRPKGEYVVFDGGQSDTYQQARHAAERQGNTMPRENEEKKNRK